MTVWGRGGQTPQSWFCPSSLQFAPSDLPPKAALGRDALLHGGVSPAAPSQDTTALSLSRGHNMPVRREDGSKGAGNEGEKCIRPMA